MWQGLQSRPIPGGWTWQTVELGGQSWKLLLPASQDAFLKATAGADEWPDPYWTQIWPAAKSLASQVLVTDWPAHTSVLELGCGSGLVGLALLARGCRVTFSDYVPLAVELALANACGNGYEHARGEVLDWRAPLVSSKFEVIIAADVLYDAELHRPLLQTIEQRLIDDGCVWLGDPGRSETSAEFLLLAAESGWIIAIFDEHGRCCDSLRRGEFRRIELRRKERQGDKVRGDKVMVYCAAKS